MGKFAAVIRAITPPPAPPPPPPPAPAPAPVQAALPVAAAAAARGPTIPTAAGKRAKDTRRRVSSRASTVLGSGGESLGD